eukprot:TRINITY_DN25048_c0_g1_i1.p1 TRINITY_DN25048_c0_g1~~TRINITY_DN25048_c0_g1_i1.p1  ORF type:complete len:493 (+),score=129.61 TRINITY_DN25048_c0_g1_i1:61-1479(+)
MAARADMPKVAVIGSGISGMSCAYLLGAKYEVTVYEAASTPGMDAQSMSLGGTEGPRIDVPIRSFSPHYYPNLLKLYGELGLKLRTVNYEQSLSEMGGGTVFKYGNMTIGGYTIPFLTNPLAHGKMVLQFLWFQWRCWWHVGSPALDDITFHEFVHQSQVDSFFYEEFLLRILSVICSCRIETIKNYPAGILVEFFGKNQTTLFTKWLRVDAGAFQVCEKLLAKVPTPRRLFGRKVMCVASSPDGDTVRVTADDGETRGFDHVVIATEADRALTLLDAPTPEEKSILGSFKYEYSTACVHSDAELMPGERAAWRTMNCFIPKSASLASPAPGTDPGMASLSVWMNNLVDVPAHMGDVFQTWNPIVSPEPSKVLRHASFQRAVHSIASSKNIDVLPMIQGTRKIHYCGSYAARGITLLEQAVVSAFRVTSSLGCPPSWEYDAPPSTFTLQSGLLAATAAFVLLQNCHKLQQKL